MHNQNKGRRVFIKNTAASAAGIALMPGFGFVTNRVTKPMKRTFGKLGFEVTTLGLGGQASLQWTPEDVDPVKIILKAFSKGINYFDTSNLYGPSQVSYGKAFREMSLEPSRAGYNESLRRSIFLTTKTHLRYAKGGSESNEIHNWTNGLPGTHSVDDVKRSLSQMFGDNQGNYPAGAYLDMVLVHGLSTMDEVDAVYEGLYDTDTKAEHIGTLAALRDFRDGTNLTGLNPKEERLIRHIGFSGHFSPPVMVEMIQRDRSNLLDAMLISVNSNDRLHFNMQHNVIPVAAAKNMGVIAMKVFADGAMYTKEPHWTLGPMEVVRTVGSITLPSRPLVEYSLTTPGVHTAIIGIGQISDDPVLCQLEQNLSASQIEPSGMTSTDRQTIEKMTQSVKEGRTNYFQLPDKGLTPPAHVMVKQRTAGNDRFTEITWDTAFAGDSPVKSYEIWRDGNQISSVAHRPQTDKNPFIFIDRIPGGDSHEYIVASIDFAGRRAESEAKRLA